RAARGAWWDEPMPPLLAGPDRPHTVSSGGCKPAPCGVLSRPRTFQVRGLPASLPGLVFARQCCTRATGRITFRESRVLLAAPARAVRHRRLLRAAATRARAPDRG